MNSGTLTIFNFLPRWGALVIAFALVSGFGALDLLTRTEIIFALFYLLPVIMASWFAGWRWGSAVSLVSVVLLYLADIEPDPSLSGSFLVYWDAAGRLVFFVFISYILSALRDALLHEKELSRIDPLTGVANSRAFYELAQREINRALRYNYPFTLAYMDIDNFKTINDTLGHPAGDELLKAVAHSLQRSVRAIDIVARVGGDEFIVMLPKAGYQESHEVLQRIRGTMQERIPAKEVPVTLSLGAVTYLGVKHSIEQIIGTADKVMYRVKSSGKNSIIHEVIE